VTQLEPRTLHQPEKLKKLSKNDLVVLLLEFESMKSVRLYLIYFQWSAGRPQAGDRILCRWRRQFRAEGKRGAGFRDGGQERGDGCRFLQLFLAVNIGQKPRWARDLENQAAGRRAALAGKVGRVYLNMSGSGLIP
jgi:hypothetical protein